MKASRILGVCPECQQQGIDVIKDDMADDDSPDVPYVLCQHSLKNSNIPCDGAGQNAQAVYSVQEEVGQ